MKCRLKREQQKARTKMRAIRVLGYAIELATAGWFGVGTAMAAEGRSTISLNGKWQIEESVERTDIPKEFTHTVPVPGLVNLAEPAFPQVDWFASREYMNRFGSKYPWDNGLPISSKKRPIVQKPVIGVPIQDRNYFWYRRSFKIDTKRDVVLLQISKSQFGTAVFLNGKPVGENMSCWTSCNFNLADAIHWQGENELLVRIGAHPAVLPENIIGGGAYSSKHKWTPGIYDEVKLILCDNPAIETIQVAPQLSSSEAIVQTKVKNYSSKPVEFTLSHTIRTWKEGRETAHIPEQREQIEGGGEKTFTQTVRIPDARLWSPEDPFLYELESRTGGDSQRTRFGMREYRFDNNKGLGSLNGKTYYLRGGNIELWLHAEDPLCGNTPWDRAWVKKLIADIPKQLQWNSFRFSLSPVPQMWLDIADEEGILVQLEPIVWGTRPQWDVQEVITEYSRWMRDNWNHPSVFMWDCNNETYWTEFTNIINTVRTLDLSNRAWENGWGRRAGPDDPKEDHAYLRLYKAYDYRGIQGTASRGEKPQPGPCSIINEYGWLWLHSDGTPLDISTKLYAEAFPNSTAEERQEYRWYMSAGETEYWRARRKGAGVMFYSYLASYMARPAPGPYHFGVFSDIRALQFQDGFKKYMIDAFKPLGVYIDFWGDGKALKDGAGPQWGPVMSAPDHPFSIVLINDDAEPVEGKLVLSLESVGEQKTVATSETRFKVDVAGKRICTLKLSIPALVPSGKNDYLLKAVAYPDGSRHKGQTTSVRKIRVDPTLALEAPVNEPAGQKSEAKAGAPIPLGVKIAIKGEDKSAEITGTAWTSIQAGKDLFSILLVNGAKEPVSGKLVFSLENDQEIAIESREVQFKVEASGKAVYPLDLPVPAFNALISNKYLLKATVYPTAAAPNSAVVCERKVTVEPKPEDKK